MPILQKDNKLFVLQTQETSYVLAVSEDGIVENLYWGKKINRLEDFEDETSATRKINIQKMQVTREECSSFGGMRFKETSMKVSFTDGVRDFRYRVSECKVNGEQLEIILTDEKYLFEIHLFYEVYPEENIIMKKRMAVNKGTDDVILERFYSGEFGLPGEDYESINYNGRWGAEFLQHSEPVTAGKKVYESLFGLTAHTVNPVFMVHKQATETTGEVFYGALAYSGNFKIVVEAVNGGFLNILAGISDTDFAWTLHGGESFETPAVYVGYSDAGFEKMTHTMHDFSRKHMMPKLLAEKELPILYNSWYSTTFSVKCEEQINLARRAAKMGVEMFVVDDGWFVGRNDDTSGLGDWYVDEEKFPEGLNKLINEVHDLGMKFGIWIEPEMVNPKSRLYAEHPEWVYAYPGREILMGRNQYELDMANSEVVDFLIDVFDKLLSENVIDYIKWDMNRYASEVGSPAWKPEQWKELHFRNTEGVYRLIRVLRERHPEVEFEACASGGGRVDFGAMQYFDEYWPSDNTDPLDRLFMHEAYSYLYPIKYMRAWLTDDFGMNQRKVPLKFSMHSAMCGALGIGIDLNSAPQERLEEIAGYISEYKKVRNIVQFGELYRLNSLHDGDIQALQYVNAKESVLFVFQDHERYGDCYHRIMLRGLNAERVYKYQLDGEVYCKSGEYLMQHGIEMYLKGDYDSRMIYFKEQ